MRYLKVFASSVMHTISLLLISAAVFSTFSDIVALKMVVDGELPAWFLFVPILAAIFFGGLSGVAYYIANEVGW